MKIVTVAGVYPSPADPGLGTFVLERVRAMRRRAEVRVIAPVPYFPEWRPLGRFRRWSAHARVPSMEICDGHVVRHPRRLVIPKVGGFTSGLFYASSLRKALLRERETFAFDLLDVHFAWPDGFGAALAARHLGVPVCLTVHGSDLNLMPRYPTIRPLIRHALRAADRVITVSESLARAARRLGADPERMLVVPNGVDTARFFPVPRRHACDSLQLAPNRSRLLSVGSLIPRKDHELLIDALAILVREAGHRDLELVIVGEGPSRRVLERRVGVLGLQAHVRMPGSVSHDALRTWFGAADLFCLTSHREGWPTVLFESWACGVPVVATAVDGVPEAVHAEQFGLLAHDRSPATLAKLILAALQRRWNRHALRAYAESNTWDIRAATLLAEFARLCPTTTVLERVPARGHGG